MNKVVLSALISIAGVIAIGLVLFAPQAAEPRARPPEGESVVVAPPASFETEPTPPRARIEPASAAMEPAPEAATSLKTEISEEGGPPLKVVHVSSNDLLAKVNDIPITLKDLLPVGEPEEPVEEVMSADMYTALLNQSIERTVIFEVAQLRGLELYAQQKRELEKLRESLRARKKDRGTHLNAVGTVEDEIDLELRNAASQFLLSSLLTQAGMKLPQVTEERITKYYEEHAEEYAARYGPNAAAREGAWRKIELEIRNKLTPVVQEEYKEELRKFVEELKDNAQITVVARAD